MKLVVNIKEKSGGETKKMKERFTKRKINTSKYLVGNKTAHVRSTHHQRFCPFLLLTGATSERPSANGLPLKKSPIFNCLQFPYRQYLYTKNNN